jgi:hypothetical protein
MSYTAPIKDMLFVMKELACLEDIATLPGFEDANLDTAQAVLEESAKLCGEVLAPLNGASESATSSSWRCGCVHCLEIAGRYLTRCCAFVVRAWRS